MISVIMPVYNEERVICRALDNIAGCKNVEIILIDGGSSDETLQKAEKYPIKIIQSFRNRAYQLNKGCQIAKGRILLFLHADCLLEENSFNAVRACIDEGFIGGCFEHKIDSSRLIFRFIEKSGHLRAKFSKIFYGDQVIFVRKDIYFRIGGIDEVELFDDVIFSKKLRKIGETCVLNKKAFSSARRWETQGIIKTTLINWLISLGFLFGISPEKLKKIYLDVR